MCQALLVVVVHVVEEKLLLGNNNNPTNRCNHAVGGVYQCRPSKMIGDDNELDVREQVFHNAIREHVVSRKKRQLPQ